MQRFAAFVPSSGYMLTLTAISSTMTLPEELQQFITNCTGVMVSHCFVVHFLCLLSLGSLACVPTFLLASLLILQDKGLEIQPNS